MMWPFDDLFGWGAGSAIDAISPLFNIIAGIGLMFCGILGFKFIPGKTGTLIALILLGVGLAMTLGYLVIF